MPGVGGDGGVGDDLVPIDTDDDGSQGSEGPHELPDRDPGSVLEVAGDREGGEHDGKGPLRWNRNVGDSSLEASKTLQSQKLRPATDVQGVLKGAGAELSPMVVGCRT